MAAVAAATSAAVVASMVVAARRAADIMAELPVAATVAAELTPAAGMAVAVPTALDRPLAGLDPHAPGLGKAVAAPATHPPAGTDSMEMAQPPLDPA